MRVMVVALLAILVPAVVGAQLSATCGDADGNGAVTVSDGVQVLRAAAGLSSACSVAACDVDRNGSITISDGVDVLRLAASLSAPDCPEPDLTPTPTNTPAASPGCGVHFIDSCTDTSAPEFDAAAGRVFVEGRGEVPSQGSALHVSLSGQELTAQLINIPESVGLVFSFSGGAVSTTAEGHVVGESSDSSGGTVCIDESGNAKRVTHAAHQRVEICKVCAVGQTVLGSFDALYEVEDGSECRERGEFEMFRQR